MMPLHAEHDANDWERMLYWILGRFFSNTLPASRSITSAHKRVDAENIGFLHHPIDLDILIKQEDLSNNPKPVCHSLSVSSAFLPRAAGGRIQKEMSYSVCHMSGHGICHDVQLAFLSYNDMLGIYLVYIISGHMTGICLVYVRSWIYVTVQVRHMSGYLS